VKASTLDGCRAATSLTAMEIVRWATAELVDTGSVLSTTGCPLAQSKLVE
jgi:hypothetical protein